MSDVEPEVHEVRVHGVGDKDALSSLGPATVLHTVGDGRAEIIEPPPVPAHHLHLVNWAKWNRTGWAVAWILCWPFTLINAAGQMRPENRRMSKVHGLAMGGVSLLASAVSLVWVGAAAEAVVRRMPLPQVLHGHSGQLALGLAAAVLVAVIAFRSSRADHPSIGVSLTHSATVIAAAGAVIALRPSQTAVAWDHPLLRGLAADSYTTQDLARIPSVFAAQGEGGIVGVTQYVDPLAWAGYGSLALVALALLVAMLAQKSTSLQCAAVTSVIAIAVVNLYGAVLFAASKTVVGAIEAQPKVQRFLPSDPRVDDVLLIGRTGHGYSTHVFPLLVLLGVVATAASVALVAARFPLALILRRADRRKSINRWAHDHLPQVSRGLTNALWIASLVILLLIEFLGLGVGVMANRWGDYNVENGIESFSAGRPTTILLTAAGLVLTGLLFGLRNAAIRARLQQSLAFVGDVMGFWPIQTHPFAAQSYRPAALTAIRGALREHPAEPTALIGHSQGSVLSAWYLANDQSDQHAPALITCGSPLISLYRQFFPAHFDDDFFQRASANSDYWINVWRNGTSQVV